MRKIWCFILCCFIIVAYPSVGYATARTTELGPNSNAEMRATNYFQMNIAANGKSIASETLSLEAGEKVQIDATYSPSNAVLYVGLIDSSGTFHYLGVSGGNVDITVAIESTGDYRVAVINNSVYTVHMSGYVKY